MIHRRLALFLTVPLMAALAACGGDSPAGSPVDTTPDTTPDTMPGDGSGAPSPGGEVPHPTGADDVVVRLEYSGGYLPVGAAFTNVPTVLITGDGRVLQPGVTTAQYPGPLVDPIVERTIDEAGIQNVLALAAESGLLQDPPEYASNDLIADASDTVVRLDTSGESVVHRAYALGMSEETDPDRARLQAFVTALSDVGTAAGEDNLGPETPFAPAAYRMMAMVVDPAIWEGADPAPTERDWPADAPLRLATAAECAVIGAAVADPLFADATELTFFVDEGVTYQLFVAPLLPGDADC